MIRQYHRRGDIAAEDVRYIFEPGHRVLLRRKEPGKLKARARGPYVFLRYSNRSGTVAEVMGPAGRAL